MYPLFGFGIIIWLLGIAWGLYLLFLFILVPWLIYRIRVDTRDTKKILLEISKQLASEPHPGKKDLPIASPEVSFKESQEESPIVNSDIRKPQAKEVQYKDKADNDLRYAPPEMRK